VAALVKNSGPAVQRMQLPAEASAPLMAGGGHALQNGDAPLQHAADDDGGGATSAQQRDPETFDDGEFYAQLLKEFLEASGDGAAAAAAGSAALAQVCFWLFIHSSHL
jgi:hypothetical protein